MKVIRCLECGHVHSEIWKELDSCPECSGGVEHLDEDMGPRERIPRVLKIGGILLVIVSVIIIVYGSFNVSTPESLLHTALVILLVAILFLGISLAYGYVLSREACVKVEETTPASRRRRGASPAYGRGGGSMRKDSEDGVIAGRVSSPRGTKILPGRK